VSKSNIEWTGETWNPVIGCTKVSEGCRNCYAEKRSRRLAAIADATVDRGGVPSIKMNSYTRVVKYKNDYPLAQWSNRVVCIEESLKIPMKVRKPTTWFVNSMSDLFHPDVPFDFIDKVFAVMALCPRHTFQILTKRPERMAKYLDRDSELNRNSEVIGRVNKQACFMCEWDLIPEIIPFLLHAPIQYWPLKNVWLGTSVENQETADERIPHLLKCPAAIRFLSCEPLLGMIDLHNCFYRPRMGPDDPYKRLQSIILIKWVIVGGESGPGARQFNIDWARSLRDQCRRVGVPFYMKQLGAKPRYCGALKSHPMKLKSRKGNDMAEWPADLRVREMPEVK